jgi:hypothetical protein
VLRPDAHKTPADDRLQHDTDSTSEELNPMTNPYGYNAVAVERHHALLAEAAQARLVRQARRAAARKPPALRRLRRPRLVDPVPMLEGAQ